MTIRPSILTRPSDHSDYGIRKLEGCWPAAITRSRPTPTMPREASPAWRMKRVGDVVEVIDVTAGKQQLLGWSKATTEGAASWIDPRHVAQLRHSVQKERGLKE